MPSLTKIFGSPVLVIEEDEVRRVFPLSSNILAVTNRISQAILMSPSSFGAYDKSSINFSGTNPISRNRQYSGKRLPTKLRTMMGAGRCGAWVKILAANELTNTHKRAYSSMMFIDRQGEPRIWMGGDAITDYRTASSAAVGVAALAPREYSVAIFGVGNVGKTTAYALQALEKKPQQIILTAQSKKQYGSVKERMQALMQEWRLAASLQAAETLAEAASEANVIVDAIAAPHYQPVITKDVLGSVTTPLLYVDTGKQSISEEALKTFNHFFVDSKPLARYLPSPIRMFIFATEHETVYEDEFLAVGRMLQGTLCSKGERNYYAIIGVPTIDAAIAEYILKTLSADSEFKMLLEQAMPHDALDVLYSQDGWF